MISRPEPIYLTDEQKAEFHEEGYLIVKGVLDAPTVAHYKKLVLDLDARERARDGIAPEEFVQVRNAVAKEPGFLDLLDWPGAFPLVAELMGPEIQLCTSHSMVRPPQPKDTPDDFKRIGWHRDGCASVEPVHGTYPWIYTKIGYFLSDLSEKNMGNLRVIPRSHKSSECPPRKEGAADPDGAITVCVEAGDAVLFQQRTWHAVGPNTCDHARVNIYVGYCYRWVKPLDYLKQDDALIAQATPVQRQLLGEEKSEMTFWLPKPEEVPLRGWLRDHQNRQKKSEPAVAMA